jgi:L-fucono-1,5-lactonase
MLIDSHQHFWRYTTQEFDWISDDMSVLRKDHFPEHLTALLAEHNIAGTVAVQARQSNEETQWLLALAEKNKTIMGVVGWIDLRADDLEQQLDTYKNSSWLKGFRHVLQDEPDDAFMLDERFVRGIKLIAERGYCYDILVHANQLATVCEFVERLPVMPLVLDHIAKPDIATQQWQPWARYIEQLAKVPHLYCKVSGMVTEANWHQWDEKTFEPYIEQVIKCFGPQRVMFGSDWPVCTVAASYSQVHSILANVIKSHYVDDYQAIMGENAQTFYHLASNIPSD